MNNKYISLLLLANFLIFGLISCKRKDDKYRQVEEIGSDFADMRAVKGHQINSQSESESVESFSPEDDVIKKLHKQINTVLSSSEFEPMKSRAWQQGPFVQDLISQWEDLSSGQLKNIIWSSEFDELYQKIDPKFYHALMDRSVIAESGELDPMDCREGISSEPVDIKGASLVSEKEKDEQVDSGDHDDDKPGSDSDVDEDGEETGWKPSLSNQFLGMVLGVSTIVSVQKFYNLQNNIGVSNKNDLSEVRKMKIMNASSLGFTLAFIAMAGILLLEGEDNQTGSLVTTFSLLIAVDSLVNFVEARNYIVEGKNLYSGKTKGLDIQIDDAGKLSVGRANLGYADVMGTLVDKVNDLPDSFSRQVKTVGNSASVSGVVEKKISASELHRNLLRDYYLKLSELSLQGSDLNQYLESVQKHQDKRLLLMNDLEKPGLPKSEKAKIRKAIDSLDSDMMVLRDMNSKKILASDGAKELLIDLMEKARIGKITLNLPDNLKSFMDTGDLRSSADFDQAFRGHHAQLPERYKNISESTVKDRAKSVKGSTGILLVAGGISLIAFSIVGLGAVKDNLSASLKLAQDDPARSWLDAQMEEILLLLRASYAQKWQVTCDRN